jgi:hypothetical protein
VDDHDAAVDLYHGAFGAYCAHVADLHGNVYVLVELAG